MRLILMIFLFAVWSESAEAIESIETKSSIELIDELMNIDAPTIGLDGMAQLEGFLPLEKEGNMTVGVIGSRQPSTSPEMRELVRRGPTALRDLVQHIDDSRPTKLWVGRDQLKFVKFFMDEYDPKIRTPGAVGRQSQIELGDRPITGEYNVRVGDVCYAIIGQIVNRQLLAVRYQPSGIIIVNSPVQSSSLADRVRADWSGADSADLRKSLEFDANNPSLNAVYKQAITRLDFYFHKSREQ